MSLENLHCPQFVDFTATETFDINDGADFFFEKGVVGELGAQMDLGMFGSGGDPFDKGVQEVTEKLSNMTNLTPKQQMPSSKCPTKKADKTPTYEAQNYQTKPDDKENQHQQPKEQQAKTNETMTPQKPAVTRTAETIDDIEQKKPATKEVASNMMLDSAISSAIEMILAAKKTQPSSGDAQTPEKPESLRESLSSKKSSHCDEEDNSTPVLPSETQPETQNCTPVIIKHTTPEPPKSSDLSKPTAASLNKQKVPVINGGTNPNIVKKTLAKMTAAFKPYKPIVVQGSGSAAGSKRSNYGKMKPSSTTTAEAMNGRANTSTSNTPKPLNTSRTRDGSTSNESRLARPMSPEAGSNRRCSSVPRTLRERQALNNSRATAKSTKNGNTFGEKLQNFFNSNSRTSKQGKTGSQTKTSVVKSTPKNQDMNDRRRSRSVNESINVTKTGMTPSTKQKALATSTRTRRISQNDSMNATKSGGSQNNKSSYTKITASPSFSKPRQKSAERTVCVPQGVTSLYTGVKFVPNTSNLINIKKKYNENCLPAFSGANSTTSSSRPASVLTSALGALPVEDILKNRPPCLAKNIGTLNSSLAKKPAPFMRTTPGKSASFRSNPTNTSLSMKPHAKSNMSDLNLSVDKANLNSSAAAGGFRVRKQSDSSTGGSTTGIPGLRHTELRALKRQEYDQQMKEKEKHAAILKHEMDQEKLRKQAEEIQKIRNQRNFRSNPIKHYKPVTLKPSEKSLTEPKSPNLSTSINKLNDISRGGQDCTATMSQSSHRLSMALVDAPLGRKNCTDASSNKQNTSGMMSCKARTVSQNDLRF